ncbi:MAG: LIM domain-containing protein [Roseiflexaceae bacterium]
MALPTTTPTRTSADRCAICGGGLDGALFFMPNRPERYCAACVAQRPRCDGCGAPVGPGHWRLHDGRINCARCHATAIYDLAFAQELFYQTVGAVVADLGLTLRVGVAFRMLDAPDMARLRAAGDTPPPREGTLGLYQRQGSLRVIYMLYGLPRLTFRMVVAHEYAHAWQGETCPLLDDYDLREGFAEWVAYRHLRYIGAEKAARQLLESSHPYRPLLERVLAVERARGPAGVIDHILAVGRGSVVL